MFSRRKKEETDGLKWKVERVCRATNAEYWMQIQTSSVGKIREVHLPP